MYTLSRVILLSWTFEDCQGGGGGEPDVPWWALCKEGLCTTSNLRKINENVWQTCSSVSGSEDVLFEDDARPALLVHKRLEYRPQTRVGQEWWRPGWFPACIKFNKYETCVTLASSVFRSRIQIRSNMFLGIHDPDPQVRGMDPDLALDGNGSIIIPE